MRERKCVYTEYVGERLDGRRKSRCATQICLLASRLCFGLQLDKPSRSLFALFPARMHACIYGLRLSLSASPCIYLSCMSVPQSHPFPGCYSSLRLLYTSSLSAVHLESKVIGPCDSYRFTVARANPSRPVESFVFCTVITLVCSDKGTALRHCYSVSNPFILLVGSSAAFGRLAFGFHVVGPQ